MFDKGNWEAITAIVKYNEDLTVWAATTPIKGENNKKYNLLWLLCRKHKGLGGRGEMDMNISLSSILKPTATVIGLKNSFTTT